MKMFYKSFFRDAVFSSDYEKDYEIIRNFLIRAAIFSRTSKNDYRANYMYICLYHNKIYFQDSKYIQSQFLTQIIE